MKDLLINGRIVEVRNGEKYIVMDNRILSLDGYLWINDFNDNLIMKPKPFLNNEFDIMKIYDVKGCFGIGLEGLLKNYNYQENPSELELIWKREDLSEFEVEILKSYLDKIGNIKFNKNSVFMDLKEKGKFKAIYNTGMWIEDILKEL